MFLIFAAAEMAVGRDEQILLWCVGFGLLGGFCSLRFSPPPADKPAQAITQVIVNMILSGAFSPWFLDWISYCTGATIGIKLAFPVAVLVGIGADQSVGRLYPKLQASLEAAGERWFGIKFGLTSETKPDKVDKT